MWVLHRFLSTPLRISIDPSLKKKITSKQLSGSNSGVNPSDIVLFCLLPVIIMRKTRRCFLVFQIKALWFVQHILSNHMPWVILICGRPQTTPTFPTTLGILFSVHSNSVSFSPPSFDHYLLFYLSRRKKSTPMYMCTHSRGFFSNTLIWKVFKPI